MARSHLERDIAPTLSSAAAWIDQCLIQDGSLFNQDQMLWTEKNVAEAYTSFVDHPDYGGDDFTTKLKRQIGNASTSAKQLTAEMLWALYLFPSNMKARTKRKQITDCWNLSGTYLSPDHPMLRDEVLDGIGSGGPGFNNYRPLELEFLLELARNLKSKPASERNLLRHYDSFIGWIESVPREGSRQFRHMLRYFAFPERVERISSNNDRIHILVANAVVSAKEASEWSDRQLDDALLTLRKNFEALFPGSVLDFYQSPLREKWRNDATIKTTEGDVPVTVPTDEEISERTELVPLGSNAPETRQSFQIQASLSRIGIKLGFKIWIPRSDRNRVAELLEEQERAMLMEALPLNNDLVTLNTIEQIDVLWMRGRWISRAFEVEHTTAVYSGLLRMADLLALQPNMDIRLHIVAPDERREKVFREMQRPVFSLLERGPLSKSCTFVSYESVGLIAGIEHLAHMNDSILAEYEEPAGSD